MGDEVVEVEDVIEGAVEVEVEVVEVEVDEVMSRRQRM